MTESPARFAIPAGFVVERVRLTPAELAYGYRAGWLGDRDVVRVALAAMGQSDSLVPAEEELALLLSDELDRVPDLVDQLERHAAGPERPEAVWLYLALAWLYEHRPQYEDPFEAVELLYADFGYPAEMTGLVRFMPAEPGVPTGLAAIERAWRDFLSGKAEEFRARTARGGA